MLFSREQYLELMTFGKIDRPMFCQLFGFMAGLKQEWIAQGASQEELDFSAFNWDRAQFAYCGGNIWMLGGQEEKIIEENDEYLIKKDKLGRTMKLCKDVATLPLPLDYPVKDMDSWLKLKPMYEFHPSRIEPQAIQEAKEKQKNGAVVTSSILGGFDLPRQLMGEELTCLCYYEQPELMHDILDTLADTAFRVYEQVTKDLVIDQLYVHEDMAGKPGPLIGPNQVDEFIKPYYRKTWDLLSSRGTRIFDMDSDGNVEPIIDSLMDSGLNAMFPVEPAAGMDPVKLRQKYGKRLAMRGGIDKHVLRKTKKEIAAELEYKMQPSLRAGGMAFALDHCITNSTPLENYRYYVQTGREFLGIPNE